MGECRGADVGLAGVGHDVGHLGHGVRDAGALAQAPLGQDGLVVLELEVGHDRHQVGVAGALAVAVEGALDVGDAGRDRSQGVGDRAAGVVVAVDAEAGPGPLEDLADDVRQLCRAACRRWCRRARRRRRRPRRRPGRPRARTPGSSGSRRRSARRRGRPAAPRPGRCCTVSVTIARFSARVVRRASSTWRSKLLATRVTTGAPDSRSAATSASSAATAPGRRVAPNAASCAVLSDELGLGPAEELGVLGVGAGPATLDEAHAEIVEVPSDGQLVDHRQRQALLLGAVAQRGVVDVEAVGLGAHRWSGPSVVAVLEGGAAVWRLLWKDEGPPHGCGRPARRVGTRRASR